MASFLFQDGEIFCLPDFLSILRALLLSSNFSPYSGVFIFLVIFCPWKSVSFLSYSNFTSLLGSLPSLHLAELFWFLLIFPRRGVLRFPLAFLYHRESNLAISSSPVKKTMYMFSNVLFSLSLDLLQLIARGHCRFSTVRKSCFALCKEFTPVLHFFQTI